MSMTTIATSTETSTETNPATSHDELRAADRAEGARIREVVRAAADTAFRARVQSATTRLVNQSGQAALVEARNAAGITRERWLELASSTDTAVSPEEFRAFARVLRVSPRWLAIGQNDTAEVAL